MQRNIFERGLAGEPTLRTDPVQVAQRGAKLVRRRRTAAVAAVATTAVAITLGAAFIPKMTGNDTAAPDQIPGCAVVLGPTATRTASTSPAATDPAAGSISTSTSGSTAPASTGASSTTSIPPPPAAAVTAPVDTDPAADTSTPTPATTTSTTATTATADETLAAESDLGPTSMTDLSQPPDPLTGLLWDQFGSWGVSVHSKSMLGDLSFYGIGDAGVSASGWAQSATGEGEAFIQIGRDEQGGAPACHVGELDQRVTYPDGTIVDLSYGTNLAASNLDPVGVPVVSFHAVAHKPDGTLVIAYANNSVQLGDDDPNTEVGGIRTTTAPPLTLDQVQSLVVEPIFTLTNPGYLQAVPEVHSRVPDVTGLTQQDAVYSLQQAGFTVDTSTGTTNPTGDPTADTAVVVAQTPAGGEASRRSTPIRLTYGP